MTEMETRIGRTAGLALAGSVVAGMLAAYVLTLVRPGLGWFLSALAVAGVVVAAGRVEPAEHRDEHRAEHRDEHRAERVVAGIAAVALLASAVIRSAGWLFALCVLVSLPLAAYAATGGRTWLALGRALARPLTQLLHAGEWLGHAKLPARIGAIRGTAIGVTLLAVFGALFVKADPHFASAVRSALPTPFRIAMGLLVFLLVTPIAIMLAYLRSHRPEPLEAVPHRARGSRLDWAIPIVLLDGLFAWFVVVQLPVLFGGRRYVLAPGGPDFAAYARGGFIELLVVTVLTLLVIAVVSAVAARATPADRTMVRVFVGLLTALTLVIVWSALQRMDAYVDAYGFTRPRLLATALEIWLGAVVVLVMVAGARLNGSWLPRAVVATLVAVLVALVAINPDAYIARTIIGRYHHDGHLDANYLASLSPDAAGAIATLPHTQAACALSDIEDLPKDHWYDFNLSRRWAREVNRRLGGSEYCLDHYE